MVNKIRLRPLASIVLGALPVLGIAGPGGTTCATAEVAYTLSTYSGDTSGAGYGNPVGAVGPLPSPANDAIYKLTPNGSSTLPIQFTGQYPWAIYLTTTCAGTAASPLEAASGSVGATGSMPVDNGAGGALAAGTYYLIVTGDPSQPASANGPFTFVVTGYLPVALQSFTID